MAEYFGYTKNIKGPDSIGTTAAVLVKIDGGDVKLAQSVTVEYQRAINPQFELGSEDIYYTIAPASGTCSIERIVGMGKALDCFKPKDPCKLQSITIASGNPTCGAQIGTISMRGICQSVKFSASVGQFTVTDGATYQIGNLDIN